MKKIIIAFPILIAILGLVISLLIALNLEKGSLAGFNIASNRLLNFTWNMQLMIIPISFVAIGLSFFIDRKNAKTFFRFNLGYSNQEDHEWHWLGPLMALVFTMGTLLYMSISVRALGGVMNEYFFQLLPLVLLFSLTNAWTEEVITRFVIVSGLSGKLSDISIIIISGSIFGLAHINGTPSGLMGVIISGVMGGLLAKSVIETKSLGWALLIHFLQDVVIFGAGAMVLAKNN